MKRALRMMMFLCLPVAAVGCAGAAGPSSEPAANAAAPAPIASLPTADGRSVDFFEPEPGLILTVESGVVGADLPVVTPDLAAKSATELYAALAPAGRAIPEALQAAQARSVERAAVAQQYAMAEPEAVAKPLTAGAGPQFFTSGEQQWFDNTFCNGAQACAQGWDWASIYSNRTLSSAFGVGWIGSESTVNGTFDVSTWQCHGNGLFGLGSTTCSWGVVYHAVIAPGHWVSDSSSNYNNQFHWAVGGPSPGTQVSLAAKF